MDFLVNAFFDHETEKLQGVTLVTFDPNEYTRRPYVSFCDVEKLKSKDGLTPCGFELNKEGILCADSRVRNELTSLPLNYLAVELQRQQSTQTLSLIDVILYGVITGAKIVQNYDALIDGSSTTPTVITMSNLKVSASSFNIYGTYKNEDNEYRTFSLINIVNDESYPFIMAVREDADEMLDHVRSLLEPVPTLDALHGYNLYRVKQDLKPAYIYMGEAFVNYLAYSVAFYGIGLKILNSYSKALSPVDLDTAKPADSYTGVRKVPTHNISVISEVKNPQLEKVASCLSDEKKLIELLKKDTECYVTFAWLKNINEVAADLQHLPEDVRYATAAVNLIQSCKMNLLRYGLELLSQRLFIYNQGLGNDQYNLVLQGGGVNGCSIRTTVG